MAGGFDHLGALRRELRGSQRVLEIHFNELEGLRREGFEPQLLWRRGESLKEAHGWNHQQLRRSLARQVAAGLATCARCGRPIDPDEAWDLGHDDFDRTIYKGPEHRRCNRATSRKRHTSRRW